MGGLLGRLGPCTGTRKAQHHPSGQLQPTCLATDSNLLGLAQGLFAAAQPGVVWTIKGKPGRGIKEEKKGIGKLKAVKLSMWSGRHYQGKPGVL